MSSMKYGRKERGHYKGKISKECLTSAKDSMINNTEYN